MSGSLHASPKEQAGRLTHEGPMQVVWGEVQAIIKSLETSSRIVVMTYAHGLSQTIDAQIGLDTIIARGIRLVPLSDIKTGEFVELSYITIEDHAVACLVYLRAEQAFMRA